MTDIVSSFIILGPGTPREYIISPLLYSSFSIDSVSNYSSVQLVKFADDTTLEGLVTNTDESEYRHEVNLPWCDNKKNQLNASKTRELIADFRKKKTSVAPVIINGELIEKVHFSKCTIISSELGWENNTFMKNAP